ncbi:hypothetical protein ANCCAN_25444 [Ancylostoma caninum]|uniref:Uncharacterized protein n=1 Tax=Ancylostoma caninum TaxID=29170 RepID=A0A368FF66_ANCCA|nr:hypothetical protein ANCCAN_25444 [Ancylostoma caninum]
MELQSKQNKYIARLKHRKGIYTKRSSCCKVWKIRAAGEPEKDASTHCYGATHQPHQVRAANGNSQRENKEEGWE